MYKKSAIPEAVKELKQFVDNCLLSMENGSSMPSLVLVKSMISKFTNQIDPYKEYSDLWLWKSLVSGWYAFTTNELELAKELYYKTLTDLKNFENEILSN